MSFKCLSKPNTCDSLPVEPKHPGAPCWSGGLASHCQLLACLGRRPPALSCVHPVCAAPSRDRSSLGTPLGVQTGEGADSASECTLLRGVQSLLSQAQVPSSCWSATFLIPDSLPHLLRWVFLWGSFSSLPDYNVIKLCADISWSGFCLNCAACF